MSAHVDNVVSGNAMTHARRNALLVIGAEGPGPATLAGILRILGMRAPTLGERSAEGPDPRWMAGLHTRLLARANVAVDDGRPDAWFETGRISVQEQYRLKAEEWLGEVLAEDEPDEASAGDDRALGDRVLDDLVLEDAALPWFLELWTGAADRFDLDVAHVIMLDPPALAGGPDMSPLGSAVSWLNRSLHVERATRGTRRAAIRHADLLEDWTVPVYGLGERWGLHSVMEARTQGVRAVHEYVDRAPRAAAPTQVPLPEVIQTLIQSTAAALDRLAEGKDDELLHRDLDELRAAFIDVYEQAADVAGSSIRASERRLRRAKERSERERGRTQAAARASAPPQDPRDQSIVRKAGRAWRRLRG